MILLIELEIDWREKRRITSVSLRCTEAYFSVTNDHVLKVPCGDKKNHQKFFKISQRVLVAQRSCEFQNVLEYRTFFLRKFLKLPNFFKGAPASDFRLSTLKKGPKNAPMTSKSIFWEGSKNSNAPRFRVQGTYATQEFSKKIIFQTHKPKKLFFEFIDPQISKKFFFFNLKIESIKWFVGPKNPF